MVECWTAAGQGVLVEEHPRTSVHMLRLRRPTHAMIDELERLLGCSLPLAPNEAAGRACRAIWMGPHEWMIVGSGASPDRVHQMDGAASSLMVPVGDGRFRLSVGGDRARDFLAGAISIDLHPRTFPVDRSAMTLFAQVPTVIDHVDADRFHLWFDISHRAYVRAWCQDGLVTFSGVA